MHIFREHKEADAWAEKGVSGQREEWEHDSQVVDCVGSVMGVVVTAFAEQHC